MGDHPKVHRGGSETVEHEIGRKKGEDRALTTHHAHPKYQNSHRCSMFQLLRSAGDVVVLIVVVSEYSLVVEVPWLQLLGHS